MSGFRRVGNVMTLLSIVALAAGASAGPAPSATAVVVDSLEVVLDAGGRLLLCSDGLTNALDDDAIEAVLEGEPDAQAAVDLLVSLANSAGGADNVTAVVIDLRSLTG
jgi:serine/threonine protein phosphatase PrpC